MPLLTCCPSGRAIGLLVCSFAAASIATAQIPTFSNVTVHDPSVVRDGSQFYVFGSHLASARTSDWQHWTQLSTSPTANNPLVPDPQTHFAEAIAWVGGENAFWAPDVIRLGDGRYYYYYCIGRLDQPRAVLGIAVSDTITGPYTDLGVILRSGMWGQPSADGTIYDPTKHPNAVDPDVFFDQTGRLWMVYGSYSGGIFILELDPATGFPLPDQGYGKKLIGGHHSRIEGAFVLYSPESEYYYLFLSYGGLAADGGYNMRLARSRTPDGPYFDSAGNELTHVSGPPGSFFDDAAIAPYGAKLLGNYRFLAVPGEPTQTTRGYLSPGHNSAYYDPLTGKHFLVFHTRFVGRGEEHEVRVHQLYMNADEWLVAAPHRYAGESLGRSGKNHVPGDYKLINHGKAIAPTLNSSAVITLRANGTVVGAATGAWKLTNDNDLTLTLAGTTFQGVFSTQWDDDQGAWVHAFSALSPNGVAIWGSKPVMAKTPAVTVPLPDRFALFGETMQLAMPRPRENPKDTYSYSVVNGPTGLTIDRATGMLTWRPTLSQVDVPHAVTVLALNTSVTNPFQTYYAFTLTAKSANIVRRVDLDFSSAASSGVRDVQGQFTGFTARLPGTGAALPSNDPKLQLDTANSKLVLTTTQADFNGRTGLPGNSSPGLALAELGFTGSEDFAVTAVFRPLNGLQFIDQVGVYVGATSDAVTRAGTIVWSTPERYSTHSQNGGDHSGRFFGFGLDVTDGLTVTLTREGVAWRYFVDGAEWNPLGPTAFLDGRADLTAGIFAITPLNNIPKAIELDSFTLVVATHEPQLTGLQQWRIIHFAQLAAEGIAADDADPDGDTLSNLQEFTAGTDPLEPNSP
jgi:arabinan endo-1,5-alpha-L-arabinosidase